MSIVRRELILDSWAQCLWIFFCCCWVLCPDFELHSFSPAAPLYILKTNPTFSIGFASFFHLLWMTFHFIGSIYHTAYANFWFWQHTNSPFSVAYGFDGIAKKLLPIVVLRNFFPVFWSILTWFLYMVKGKDPAVSAPFIGKITLLPEKGLPLVKVVWSYIFKSLFLSYLFYLTDNSIIFYLLHKINVFLKIKMLGVVSWAGTWYMDSRLG